jgi:hypothetical protein
MGADHDLYAEGLRKSLFNYMHEVGFDMPLKKWFDFKVPPTSVPPRYIEQSVSANSEPEVRSNAIVTWLGRVPTMNVFEEKEKNQVIQIAELEFYGKKSHWTLTVNIAMGEWLMEVFPKLSIQEPNPLPLHELSSLYEGQDQGKFSDFTQSYVWQELRDNGLLIV